jgi:hypothetical protein
MQDRYVGDIGDYAKYALLRALTGGKTRLSLGILWYLYPDESHNGDGRHVAYLQQSTLADRDPELYAVLGQLVASGRRSVEAVERSRILPEGTMCFTASVATLGRPAERVAHRAAWFSRGLRKVAAADLVFFDPDNGLETPALDKRSLKAGKYVYWSELEAIWAAGKSVVVYNHLNRSASATVQTERLAEQFEARLVGAGLIMPLLFRRGSCRHIWIVAQPHHADDLEAHASAFLSRGWASDTQIGIVRPAAFRRTTTSVGADISSHAAWAGPTTK